MAQHVDALHQQLGHVSEDERRSVAVAVAESLTGGERSARLAATPGSGDWFLDDDASGVPVGHPGGDRRRHVRRRDQTAAGAFRGSDR